MKKITYLLILLPLVLTASLPSSASAMVCVGGDLNVDGETNWQDMRIFVEQWLNPPGSCSREGLGEEGPVGWWKFDEDSGNIAHDLTCSKYHGTLNGNPAWATGHLNGALDFDGTGDFVTYWHPDEFDITGSITVSAWVKVTAWDKSWQTIVSMYSSWSMRRDTTAAYWELPRHDAFGFFTQGTGQPRETFATTPLDDGQWHHVAGTYDRATGKQYVYTDGMLEASSQGTVGAPMNVDPACIFTVGAQNETGNVSFNGLIDDVRIYDRALNESEIEQLMLTTITPDHNCADMDGIDGINMIDFALLAQHWLDIAPVAPRADMEHVVVRQAPSGRYAMYGGLTKLPDGEIFCVYKVGSLDPNTGSPWTVRDETIVWTKSQDQGHTWPQIENIIYADPCTRQENCCGTGYLAEDGRLIHPFYILNPDYTESSDPNNWSYVHLAETTDSGQTWQIPLLDLPLHIAASFGGIITLQDGTLLLNVYGAAEQGTFRHQAAILRSVDDANTWTDYTIIGATADPDGGPARLNETDIVQTSSGRLLSMSRTQYGGPALYRGFSSDGGWSWSVEDSGLHGLCPALEYTTQVGGPPEGIVAIVYHDRWGEHTDKGGIYIAFSCDEGQSWGEQTRISGGAYPCVIETEPGLMFCTYYRSSTVLRGTFFTVPFPTGLRATTTASNSIRLEWDLYNGQKASDYSYHIYRSIYRGVELIDENRIGIVSETSSFNDEVLEPDTAYFYRVVARDGESQVGMSWLATGYTGNGSQ